MIISKVEVGADKIREIYNPDTRTAGRWEYTIKCEHCGEEFQTWNANSLYCGDECKQQKHQATRLQKKIAGRDKICLNCQKSFKGTRLDAKYCSSACKQEAYRKREPAGEQKTLYLIEIKYYNEKNLDAVIEELKANGVEVVYELRTNNGNTELAKSKFLHSNTKYKKLYNVFTTEAYIHNLIYKQKKMAWNTPDEELKLLYQKYVSSIDFAALNQLIGKKECAALLIHTNGCMQQEWQTDFLLKALKKSRIFEKVELI
jgi:hypothetical protein